MVDILGIVAGVFIFSSLTFKCVSVKTNIIMRILNATGSALFVVYGALLWAGGGDGWSLVVCNGLLVIFNTYHLIRLCVSRKKQRTPDALAVAATDTTANTADLLTTVKQLADQCQSIDELRAELAKLN